MTPHPTENILTLTVNSRLARWLLLEQDEQKKQAGEKAWETPQILPLSAWLKRAWLETWPEKYLLSKIQSESLWEKIINSAPNVAKLGLLHKKAAASQAYQAYTLVHEFKLSTLKSDYQETLETISFFQWMERFEKQLLKWNALDNTKLMDQVSELIDAGKIKLVPSINFKGFNKKTPQLQMLLNSMERKGVDFSGSLNMEHGYIFKRGEAKVSVQKYGDKNQEAVTCARWIRKLHQPGKRFGIIAPELESYRSLLQRELAAELCPSSITPGSKTELPFNVSLGSPLSQTTPVNLILQVLGTQTCDIPAEIFYSIIRSSVFLSGKSAALELERELREQELVVIDLRKLQTRLDSEKSPELCNFIIVWEKWALNNQPALPSQWSSKISTILQEMNWPGKEEKFTAKENLIYESWKNCLDQLASLSHILGKVHRLAAVKKLAYIAQDFLFPEKNRDHLIQVISLSESTGMQFDHTWIMGCHSEALPPSPEPNTFIPFEFRKKYKLPRSSAKWELENCEQHLGAIFESSGNIVFSYPLQERGNVLGPSPLLKIFPQEESFNLPSARLKEQIRNATTLELLEEKSALPFSEDEKYRFEIGQDSGGANLLKFQADCPFRAFARYRLHALNNNIPDTDFDPRVRGKLIHRILELFWRKTQTRTQLEDLHKTGKLEREVRKYVQQATSEISRTLPEQPEFLKMEEARNTDLIMEWLTNFEMTRNDFTVLKPEKSETARLGGLTLKVRIDRIDETQDNKHVLIDYKTGNAKPAEWLTERILSPQLPLYSTLISPAVVVFAQMKKGEMGLKGVRDPSLKFSGLIKPTPYSKKTGVLDWNGLLDFWKDKIDLLANEFLAGRTTIEPALKQETCKNCDLDGLCRIRERDYDSEDAES